ncbi:cytochrome P450 [Nocardioides gilvus]|uniref:cytochrome P450 n=1 Tax=Nocardioides gilvus TaxID=1735589 RepID=UPI001EF560F1|nr:cytochrome P450 [Nocardioides gilvus]
MVTQVVAPITDGRTEGPLERARAGIRSRLHWAAMHGIPGAALRRTARGGDLQARMIVTLAHGGDVRGPIEDLRAAGPVHRAKFGYVATSHAAVREVLSDDGFITGLPGQQGLLGKLASATAPQTIHPVEKPSLLATNPPEHTRYRKLVTGVFTKRAVERLRARTEEIATELLDRIAAQGGTRVDIVEAYCAQLPVTVIAEILGVPASERGRVLAFGEAAAPSLDLGLDWRSYRDVQAALGSFDAWLGDHLESLRRNPGDDLLSQLVAARDEGVGLTDLELKSTAGLVLAAGFETTVNLLSNGIALLADHPDQLAALRNGEPGATWTNAVEEVLRFDPPVLLTARVATRPTEVAGQRIGEGALVATVLWGANRDPEVFADPHTFDITRVNAREHIAFSAGRHHCLGATLARMEGEVGLRALFDRYPDLQLAPGASRRRTRILQGWKELPVTLG